MSTRKCVECRVEQPEENYYLQNGIRLFKKCKECVKMAKRVVDKKPRGFALLDPTVQAEIKLCLQDRRQKTIDVAKKFGLKYPTLCYWIRQNTIA